MVQPLEILLGGLATVPTVPIFINSVAPPFTPVHPLGAGLGKPKSGDGVTLHVVRVRVAQINYG